MSVSQDLVKLLRLAAIAVLLWNGCDRGREADSPGGTGAMATLHYFTWSDYVSPELIHEFEQAHGARVVVDTFSSNEELLAKLQGGASGYDVTVPSDFMVSIMAAQGMLADLDRGRGAYGRHGGRGCQQEAPGSCGPQGRGRSDHRRCEMKMQVAVHPRIFRFRPGLLPVILVALMAIGFVVAMVRVILGIGAISNLSNTYPWGFWISFDIYTGIAISSGAFLLAAAVYVLDIKELRPLLMPSVLTALIGYFMEVLALMVDLGRPERIFNMLFFQNYTSWMLVVGLCVMIYLAI